MANTKTFESKKMLESLTVTQLAILHKIRGDKDFKDFVSVINQIIYLDKEKQVGLYSDVADVDRAIEITSKGNFYRGRISSLVLLHSLMQNSEAELEIRERKKK